MESSARLATEIEALIGDLRRTARDVTFISGEVERVRVADAVKPDLYWVYVDSFGHIHRWRDGKLPTLRRLHARVSCTGECGDADCEGTVRVLYACRECSSWVVPRWIPDHVARVDGVRVGREPDRVEMIVNGPPPLEVSPHGIPVRVLGRTGTGYVSAVRMEEGPSDGVQMSYKMTVVLDAA